MGTLDQARADKALDKLPKFPKIQASDRYGGQNGHMLTLVRNELHALGYSDQEIDGGGLRVTTTLDPQVMKDIEDAVLAQKPEGFSDKQLHIGAATDQPGTGALLGFYGGQDYLDSQINWAVAGGMIGSTMKPITLAAAIEQGFSLKDTFYGNNPFEFPDGLAVRNEQDTSYGASISAVRALEDSVNTAFVDMTDSMNDGPRAVYDMAKKLGIPCPSRDGRQYLQVIAGTSWRREKHEDDIDGLRVHGIKHDCLLQDGQNPIRRLDPVDHGMGDGHPAADPCRAQILPGEQGRPNDALIDSEPHGRMCGQFFDQIGFRGGGQLQDHILWLDDG